MTLVLTIGIVVLDEIFVIPLPLKPGEKHRATSIETVIGGNAANSAIAITRLGAKARLVARLGDDSAAGDVRERLTRHGIDFSLSRPVEGSPTSRSAIIIEPNGDRTIVNFLDFDLPDRPEWLPELPQGTKAVLGDTRWETGARHVFERARRLGIPALFDGDRAPQDAGTLDLATHVVFSARGARELAGTDDLAEALRRIGRDRETFLGVTDGGNGVFARIDGEIRHFPAFEVRASDTLGAGDVWHGAFGLALAEAMPVEAAITFASATAALKCTHHGGSAGTPPRQEVVRFLAGYGHAHPGFAGPA